MCKLKEREVSKVIPRSLISVNLLKVKELIEQL